VNQIAHGGFVGGGAVEDLLDCGSVAEAHGGSGGVGDQLLYKIAGDLSLVL
jgi:hypothetical protein